MSTFASSAITPGPLERTTISACFLGFDYGHKKIGIAVGESLTLAARPLTTLPAIATGVDWDAIAALVDEWKPAGFVVGLPLTLEGEEQRNSAAARRFAAELTARHDLPTSLQDERMSTLAAREEFAARRRDGRARRRQQSAMDAVAAKSILELWLSEQ